MTYDGVVSALIGHHGSTTVSLADILVLGAVGADHVGGDLGARPDKVTHTPPVVHRVQISLETKQNPSLDPTLVLQM